MKKIRERIEELKIKIGKSQIDGYIDKLDIELRAWEFALNEFEKQKSIWIKGEWEIMENIRTIPKRNRIIERKKGYRGFNGCII